MDNSFEHRVALVTGGSRGIGRATALQLARGGADVAVGYAARVEAAAEVATEIRSLGPRAIHVPCDVSSQEQVDEAVRRTREVLGPIDLLVNCGAISTIVDHTELTFENWAEMIDVNLHGAFRVVFAIKDEMIERRFGRIVLVSSVAALRPRKNQIHYAAAKAGVIALTRCCAEAFALHNVRVNAIAPGVVQTEMADVLSPETLRTVLDATPMGRLGHPEEIAEYICFLLSERASFTTGQTVVASGGRVTLP